MCKLAVAVICCLTVILLEYSVYVEGGECCRGHFDNLRRYHSQTWCPIYCCGYASDGLYCCEDPLLRTLGGNRDTFCSSWFWYTHHLWAPIIIGLVILAIIVACCVGCVRCCCFI